MMAQTDQIAPKAQTNFVPSGAPIIQILFNYTEDQTQNAAKKSAFNIDRSYFGYKYDLSSTITTKIVLDAGTTGANAIATGSAYTVFVKNAQLEWQIDPRVRLKMGMQSLQQFQDQEDFWGYRYMFKSFNDQNAFGAAADLGINAEIKISKTLRVNIIAMNGEGYKNLQDSKGNQKIGGNIIFTPIKGLITKVYYDKQPVTGAKPITSLALFAAYQATDWRLAAEYNQLKNAQNFLVQVDGSNRNGMSFYGTYAINKKIEFLARYDQLRSNFLVIAPATSTLASNITTKDGGQVIGGIQYNPIKGLKLAFNYQGYNYNTAGTSPNSSKYLMSAEFRL